MTDVALSVLDIQPEPYAVTPILSARVSVVTEDNSTVQAIALRAQVRIEPMRRKYSDEEAAGLVDLFGPRERWNDTQRSFLWLHCATMLRGFTGATQVDLPLDCTYDFEVTSSRYAHALREGTIPIIFLFSGTVFGSGPTGFSVAQIPWDRESRYDMPVTVWNDVMTLHYPHAGFLRLRQDTLDALTRYKARNGLLGFDDAIATLLGHSAEEAS